MKRKVGALLLAVGLLAIPTAAFAQERGLVPCGEEGNPCTFCHLFSLGNNIITFLLFPSPINGGLALVPIAASILLAYGGIQFLLGSSGSPFGQGGFSVQKGLQAITATIVGLVIVYTSWILVETFLVFTGVSSWTGLGSWWEVECSTQAPGYTAPSEGRPLKSPVCEGGSIAITTPFSGNHDGIDIGISNGTPVRAPADGTVSFNDIQGGGGRQIKIEHEGGWETRYLHLSAAFPNVGTWVRKGEIIGKTGGDPSTESGTAVTSWVDRGRPSGSPPRISSNTASSGAGWSTAPHLHYEVLFRGRPQNINQGFQICGPSTCSAGRSYSCSSTL